jgi:hypothetical protein
MDVFYNRLPTLKLGLGIALVGSVVVLGGCGEQEFRMPPYIVQKGCEFTLVTSPEKSASTTMERGNTRVAYTLSVDKYEVVVSDCQVVDNPNGLPIYED